MTPAEIGDFVSLLVKAMRAVFLYEPNNPVYQRFIASLQAAVARFWDRTLALEFIVEEGGLRWGDHLFPTGEGRDSLAFIFFKDGVRYLTFLRGFESEAERFLSLVNRARQLTQGEDDLITLLWEESFEFFQYSYVDLLAEGLALPEASPEAFPGAPAEVLAADVAEAQAEAEQADGPQGLVSSITREDFEETLYFLDEDELAGLREELDGEWTRDLKTDVLNALFDRLEDPVPARQSEILEILHQLLPTLLSRGDLVSAATVLRELDAVVAMPDVLGPAQRAEVDRLYNELSDPEVVRQFIQSLEEGQIRPDAAELSLFFEHLRPVALPVLIGAAERTSTPAIRELLRAAVLRLARAHADQVVKLLESSDATVAMGAARAIGQMRMAAAAPRVARLLERPEPEVRLAAIEALGPLHTAEAIRAIEGALEDADRRVRIAAARGLGYLKHRPSRGRLEAVLVGKGIRDADVTEKIAFFEAYGAIGGDESIGLLDRLLNGRGLFRRRKPAEIRACAALALARVGTPHARTVLERAAQDSDPVVRSAVLRALRQEQPAS